MRKIHWVKDGSGPDSAGFWHSAEGRFDISPNFRHTVTPDSYTVIDNMGERKALAERGQRLVTTGYSPVYYTSDTVGDCKAWALRRVNK